MDRRWVLKWEHIANIALAMFAISLMNLAGYIFAAMALFMLFYNLKRIRISTPELTLLAFAVFYFSVFAFYFPISIEELILYLVGPWSAYLLGKQYVLRSEKDNALIILVTILAGGMTAHGLLNWVTTLRSSYMALYAFQRLSVDVWREQLVSVTVTGMFFSFGSGLSVGALFAKTKLRTKFVALVTLIACLAATVFFANRTLLVIVLIMVAGYFLGTLLSAKTTATKKALLILAFIAGAVLIIAAFTLNWFGLMDWFMSLKVVQRMDGDEVGRMSVWSLFFENGAFLRYPMGGGFIAKAGGMGYLHNLWLDIYNRVGVLPFIFIVVFTVQMLRRYFVFRKLMLQHHYRTANTCFTALMIATVLNCMVEPIIEANPYYFLIVLMFLGGMNGQIQRLSQMEDDQ